jgi:hypothetical protein
MVQNIVRTGPSDALHYSYKEEAGKVVMITSYYTEKEESLTRVEPQLLNFL